MPVLAPATAVGASTGTKTVNISGTAGGPDGEGSYVFTTNNSPGTVTAALKGGGLQGVLFGVKYHTIGLSLATTNVGNFVAGGTGTYTLQARNTVVTPQVNPPSAPQPVRVVDTLPAGLTYVSATGTGWSCSATGQVVTCNTTALQDLTINRTFPPITLVVNVAANAPSPLVNSAEVSDPTTSTLVYNVCEEPANGICPASATSQDGDSTVILKSNLSTSTKSVVDANGGDASPGDVLRYTITLVESSGQTAATGVSVTDVLDPDLDGSTLVVINTGGGVNNSTMPGGPVKIDGITVPAGGTVQLQFEVAIRNPRSPGTKINNVATIANGSGAGGTTPDVEVVVSESDIPVVGNKKLYVYTTPRGMSRTPQPATGTDVSIAEGGSEDFELATVKRPLVLVPGSTVSATLITSRTGAGGNRDARVMRVELFKRVGGSLVPIGGTSGTQNFDSTTWTARTFNITVPGSGSAGSLAVGNTLVLRVFNDSSGGGTRTVGLRQRNGSELSVVALDTSTVIKVDTAFASSTACSSPTPLTRVVENQTVYLCAVVSDPFGDYDVNGAVLSVTDPLGTLVVGSTPMGEVPDADAATKTYQLGPLQVPDDPPLGDWIATVTATEGTETAPVITHTRTAPINIEGVLTLTKAWGASSPNGHRVALSIGGATSTTAGSSVKGGATTAATATSPAGKTLNLIEAFTNPVNGQGGYTVALACRKDSDSSSVAVAGSGLSRSIVMPNGSSVTCTWTNTVTVPLTVVKATSTLSDPVNGTVNPKAIPGAVVEYTVTVMNPSSTAIDADTIAVVDILPGGIALVVTDIGPSGSGPVAFTGATSGLTYSFVALNNSADDIEFSGDGGATWTRVPTAGADGTDPAVNAMRVRPKGSFNPGNATFTLRYRTRVK
jgi:uncharacterized repeat protein (TIGR01451 family)